VFIDFFKAFIVLTNGHVLFDLINYILIVNKQSFFLADKCAKVIRDN
jgi:hypothetical protein